ncbi:MAG: tyrosine-type recombinase/integrase [Ruminococcus sp.]|jgi:integrase|nr:tyrosine-type recombinase/integrase [Ruminococcus sp.]
MTTQPIREKKEIKRICEYFEGRSETRNLVLFMFGIHTALRISDILKLRWGDIFDFKTAQFKNEFELTEKKTKKFKVVALNSKLRDVIRRLFRQNKPSADTFLFAHPTKNHAISRIQAYRIIKAASAAVGLKPLSCHSLRKTFGYHLWKKGTSLAIIMDIYNHSSFGITQRYLGITQDERNNAYRCLNFGL